MANTKLLQEAIQAFANGDKEVADKKMRKYFVEQAQEINKKLEEEMDSEEEEMCEDVDTGEEEDMTSDVGYKLDEEEELDEGMFGSDLGNGNSVNFGGGSASGQMTEEDETPEEDFGSDEGSEEDFGSTSSTPDADQWETIKSEFDKLEKMFDEIENGSSDFDDSDDFGDEESDDDFGDVDFGDEKVGEAYKMKNVTAPEKTEKSGVNKKSVIAPNAKSPVDGVKAVVIKDGTVDATDDKFENKDAMSVKVEDNNNVMDNGKHVMKPAKTPTNKADNVKSVVPKR